MCAVVLHVHALCAVVLCITDAELCMTCCFVVQLNAELKQLVVALVAQRSTVPVEHTPADNHSPAEQTDTARRRQRKKEERNKILAMTDEQILAMAIAESKTQEEEAEEQIEEAEHCWSGLLLTGRSVARNRQKAASLDLSSIIQARCQKEADEAAAAAKAQREFTQAQRAIKAAQLHARQAAEREQQRVKASKQLAWEAAQLQRVKATKQHASAAAEQLRAAAEQASHVERAARERALQTRLTKTDENNPNGVSPSATAADQTKLPTATAVSAGCGRKLGDASNKMDTNCSSKQLKPNKWPNQLQSSLKQPSRMEEKRLETWLSKQEKRLEEKVRQVKDTDELAPALQSRFALHTSTNDHSDPEATVKQAAKMRKKIEARKRNWSTKIA